MAAANCNSRICDIGRITGDKIYNNSVMPRCRDGTELWHSFCNGELHAPEVLNRFCPKHIPSLHRSSKVYIFEGIIH